MGASPQLPCTDRTGEGTRGVGSHYLLSPSMAAPTLLPGHKSRLQPIGTGAVNAGGRWDAWQECIDGKSLDSMYTKSLPFPNL